MACLKATMDSVHVVQCLALMEMVQSHELHYMQMMAMDHDPMQPELELELETVWVSLVTQKHNLDHQG